MDLSRTKIIACDVLRHELDGWLPASVSMTALDFGLHINPQSLRGALQAAINDVGPEFETIILGYGFCSRSVEGLVSPACRLVVPRIDDCIGIFLGSRRAHQEQIRREPGTYYLSRGWVKAGQNLFFEYDHMVERFGRQRADRLMRQMLVNYTRVAFIQTGTGAEFDESREKARAMAVEYGLRFDELTGSMRLISKMLNGPWDEEFLSVPPGREITYDDFLTYWLAADEEKTATPA